MGIQMAGTEEIYGGIEFYGHVDLALSSYPGGRNSSLHLRIAYYFLPAVCEYILLSSIWLVHCPTNVHVP